MLAEKILGGWEFPGKEEFIVAASGETGLSTAGFPFLSEGSFHVFLKSVPFLFADGEKLVDAITAALDTLKGEGDSDEKLHLERSLKVLRTVTYTAAVTSPPDLWVARFAWNSLLQSSVIDFMKKEEWVSIEQVAHELKLSPHQLEVDFALLRSRGYIEQQAATFRFSPIAQTKNILDSLEPLPNIPSDLVPIIAATLSGKDTSCDRGNLEVFFGELPDTERFDGWPASYYEMELGYRVVPIVLALRLLNLTPGLKFGVTFDDVAPKAPSNMLGTLTAAGLVTADSRVTRLGERVFARGPGPFGIIHAYHAYMTHLPELLRGEKVGMWVARGENVAASQDANRKTFALANDALDQFCLDYNVSLSVYIEHAVGQGEATRQRFERDGEDTIQYFGADLEDAAIDRAVASRDAGTLPQNMQFIRNADIGQPPVVIDSIKRSGFEINESIMIVGNGFHEVRQQSNDKMIEVFRQYCDAGILLIFTEESGLTDEDLLMTAWNTYHAGFRYVHEISGQGLRPALDKEDRPHARFSWRKCAQLGGYRVVEDYTTRTRKIFPHPRPDGYNPAISVTYFCVPERMAQRLKIKG